MPTVEIIHWPEDADRLTQLRREDLPRLIVIEPGVAPPAAADCLEDWVSADRQHVESPARLAALEARAGRHEVRPRVDGDGVLRFRGGHVQLSAVEQQLVGAMLEEFGEVVPRSELLACGWPGTEASQNLLDVHIMRLRRRLKGLGLAIRTVRARGYALAILRDEA